MAEAAKGDSKSNKDLGNLDNEEMIIRKRLPKRLPRRNTDVYVTRKTSFTHQLARCQKLLDNGAKELYIHGLGMAINRAINLALQLKSSGNGSLEVAVNTSTVELVDDLEPQNEHGEFETQSRNNSAVHIKVFRPAQPLNPTAVAS